MLVEVAAALVEDDRAAEALGAVRPRRPGLSDGPLVRRFKTLKPSHKGAPLLNRRSQPPPSNRRAPLSRSEPFSGYFI